MAVALIRRNESYLKSIQNSCFRAFETSIHSLLALLMGIELACRGLREILNENWRVSYGIIDDDDDDDDAN